MWHVICTQVNQGDSKLLTVKSQIVNLIPDLSLGHNLCFEYPNGSYEPILDIYVSKKFQWYKLLFNPMNFDLWNLSLKIQKSIMISTHLGVYRFISSHSLILLWAWNVTLELCSWFAPLQALALVTNSKLRSQQLRYVFIIKYIKHLIIWRYKIYSIFGLFILLWRIIY
jgi:hypothetical protein